jgi:hypothetical protein
VRDLPKVQDTLTRFFKGDERVQFCQAGGYQRWTVDDGTSLFVESENDNSVTVRGLALGADRLVIVPHADLLDRATVPNSQPPLSSDPGWGALVKWLDSQRCDRTAYESLLRLQGTAEASYVAAITPAKPPTERAATSAASQTDTSNTATNDWVKAQSLRAWLWRLVLFGTDDPRARPLSAVAPTFDALRPSLPRAGITMARSEHGWIIHCGALRFEEDKSP